MHLNYIELHGFKSFPDKIRIDFDKGLTAVVGPNGSGKSNISDAVRWVLGEQSSKSLRGDKMEDVIFSGTQLRNAMGFASVTLSMSNEDGRVPDAGEELLVSRRFYRSGDSEYLINGVVVRLRDVRELFMDTGLGRDGYSIIGQGRISEIVGAKSHERREIFEEAAGIAKYRFRKNEADRKLAAAEDNLARINDILGELGSRVGPLETQSRKAHEFLQLAEKKKGLEITLFCDEIRRKAAQLREQSDKIAIARGDYTSLDEELSRVRNTLEHNGELVRGYNIKIEDCYNAINVHKERDAERRSAVSVLKNDVEHNLSQIERLIGELSIYDDRLASTDESAARLREEAAAKRELLAEKDAEIAAVKNALSELIIDNELVNRRRAETAQQIAHLTGELTDYRVESVSNATQIEANATRIAAIDLSLSEQSEQKRAFDLRRAEDDALLSGIREQIETAKNRRDGAAAKRDSVKRSFDEKQERLNALSFKADETAHKIKVLEDLDRAMDGYAQSVKSVLRAKNARELPGIVGTVASLIRIKSGCETAIETALGGALQNIVVETERDAKRAIEYLKSNKSGRATFLPVDTIRPARFDGSITPNGGGAVDIADRLIECDEKYKAIMSFLLGRIVVAEDLDAASDIARRLSHKYRIVTLDGQTINTGGSYTGGYVTRSAGVLSRRGEIEELRARLTETKDARECLTAEQRADFTALNTANAEITALDADVINLSGELIRAETVIAERLRETESWQRQYEALVAEKSRLADENLRCEGRLELINGELLEKQTRLAELEAGAKGSEDSADYIRRRAELSDELAAVQIARAEMQKDVESLENSIAGLTESRGDADKRREEIAAESAALTADNERKLLEIEELQRLITTGENEQRQQNEEIEECLRLRMLKEQDSAGARRRENEIIDLRDKAGRQIASLETSVEALTAEGKRFDDRLWEEYELTRIEAQKLCVPFDSITALRQSVGELRSKIKALGNVNVGAIEEYKEVLEKYTKLKEQYDDAEGSRRELQKLIRSLTDEMRVIFKKSFADINTQFKRVFTELFGGGRANLYLTDEDDVLESGIEMDVQPPGKVIKNLASLSGGEKALVAIALYFAILAVNPSPFCLLDEIDSALDDANVARFADYMRTIMDKTQFIAITHRRGTMEVSDMLYGITMQEEGVSKLLRLDINNISAEYIG